MLVDAKELIEKIKKHKIYLFYGSGILVIGISILTIYFLIKLAYTRLNEIIPMIKVLLGNPATSVHCNSSCLYKIINL